VLSIAIVAHLTQTPVAAAGLLIPGASTKRVLASFVPFLRWLTWSDERREADANRVVRSKVAEICRHARERAAAGEVPALRSLLHLMLSAPPTSENYLTADEVTDQVLTFLVAGHETTRRVTCGIVCSARACLVLGSCLS
jgi:cytochrome P450